MVRADWRCGDTITRANTANARISTTDRCSNAEIARELNLSPGTVESCGSHMLMQLRLRDLVQAVVLATRPG
ncbi:MAG: winged helix-turn-helix transcriptional regulator [Solirubrobacterales bacterium]|nr:winged helix-turn-helix transcriptional regulator [Solirubrobacterales bacterium]MBV9714263.1 winged helix-turn-helix transcriptional regulator [Solirubrobacterales bacterium]